MKCINRAFFVILSLVLLLLPGCGPSNINLAQQSIKPIENLQVIRSPYRDLKAVTWAGGIMAGLGGLATGPLGNYIIAEDTKEASTAMLVSDYSGFVALRFMERMEKERPGFPKMTLVENPLDNKGVFEDPPFLWIGLGAFEVNALNGFYCTAVGELYDADNKLVWRHKTDWYYSLGQGRRIPMEDYFEDDAKLLDEEMRFAADWLVSELVGSIEP